MPRNRRYFTMAGAPNWLRKLDLNQRPLGYEPNELPGCSIPLLCLIVSQNTTRRSRDPKHSYFLKFRIGASGVGLPPIPGGAGRAGGRPAPWSHGALVATYALFRQ